MNRSIEKIAGVAKVPSMYAEDWPNRPRAGSVARKMKDARSWLKGVAQRLLSISRHQWISAETPPDTSRVVLLECVHKGRRLVLARYTEDRWVEYSWVSTISGYHKPNRWREIDDAV